MSNIDGMEVELTRIGDATVLKPLGEIDLSRSPSLRQHLSKAQNTGSRLVVDLSDVPYMDSSGVATLVESMQAARRSGTTLVLCGMQEKVRSIFEIARLDTVFTIVSTADEAVEA